MTAPTITIEPVLLDHQWKKNDTNFYRLRITLRRERKFIKTNILVHKDQVNRNGKPKDPAIRYELERVVRETETKLSQIDTTALSTMTLDHVVSYLENSGKEFRLDFIPFAEGVIAKKSGSSKAGYASALNSFREFIGKDSIDISQITSSLLRKWEEWLVEKHGDGARAVSAYTAALRFMHGRARAQYNNEETGYIPIKNPFQFYKPPIQKPAEHRSVEESVIKKMLSLRNSLCGRERTGVDVFLISFALMGMNCPDMYSCAPPKKGIITYNRQKTRNRRADHALMKVKIDPLVVPLVREYLAKDGDKAFIFSEMYSSYLILGENVNDGLKAFRERIKYKGRLTLYSARHAWASLAYKYKVDKGVINDCLCHVDKDMKVTDIYIDKDWSVMWKANKKVLSRFDWPE